MKEKRIRGVYPYKGKWMAQLRAYGRTYYLGYFDNYDDAVQARKKAEVKYDVAR